MVHFYQLSALDWVDITSALQADPTKASEMLKGVSTWHLNSPEEFAEVQTESKIWLPAVSWVFSLMATGVIRR
ncbi:nickel-dependent hydrogenase large subunit [Escherichia coli]